MVIGGMGPSLGRRFAEEVSSGQIRLKESLEKIALAISEELANLPNGSRSFNLCAPISFQERSTAELFVEVISSGGYPLKVAEGGINPMFDYTEGFRGFAKKYSVAVKYVRPQKNGGNAH